MNQRAGIGESRSDDAVVGRANFGVVAHNDALFHEMPGALIRGLGHVHVLLGDDVRRFFPHLGEPFIGQLFDFVIRHRLLVLLFYFRRIDHGHDLILLHGIALVRPDPFQVAGDLSVKRRLIERRHVGGKLDGIH